MYRPYVEKHWLTSSIPSGAWGAGGGRATCSAARALRRSPRWGGLLRPVRAADRLRDVHVRGVQERGLRLQERPRHFGVRGCRQEDSARAQIRRLHEGRREGGSTLDARGTRWGYALRRLRAGAAAPLPAQEEGVQPGRALGTRRRPADERTLIGYTRSRAQHAGSGRALGRREAGQRHGRVLCQGTSCGEDLAGRRRLHYGRDHERVRRARCSARERATCTL